MTTTMPNMDDLIGKLSGNMHVSQDGYDIKALHVSRARSTMHASWVC